MIKYSQIDLIFYRFLPRFSACYYTSSPLSTFFSISKHKVLMSYKYQQKQQGHITEFTSKLNVEASANGNAVSVSR